MKTEQDRTPHRRRGGLPAAALLIAGALASLLLAELVVRLLPATTLGFVYERGRFNKPPEFARDKARNALGFHDVEHGPPVPGVRRLLLLGDSYVEAGSVPLEETLGRRLEQHLNAAAGAAWEVIALGRSGWSQRQQLPALRKHGPELKPDLVLTLFLALNDVRENSDELVAAVRAQSGLSELRPGWAALRAEAAPWFKLRSSRLNQLVSYRLARQRGRDAATDIPLDYFVYATSPDARWRTAWRTSLELLEATRLETRRQGARYGLVSASTPQGVLGQDAGLAVLQRSYPAMRRCDWGLDLPDRKLASFSAAQGISFLALEPVFRDATAGGERLHWAFDGHWNALGNERAAERIAQFVLALEAD